MIENNIFCSFGVFLTRVCCNNSLMTVIKYKVDLLQRVLLRKRAPQYLVRKFLVVIIVLCIVQYLLLLPFFLHSLFYRIIALSPLNRSFAIRLFLLHGGSHNRPTHTLPAVVQYYSVMYIEGFFVRRIFRQK